MKYPTLPVVIVMWADAESHDDWETRHIQLEWAAEHTRSGPSVGFLLYQDEHHITLCGTDHGTDMCQLMKIPMAFVQSVEMIWQGNQKPPASAKTGKQRPGARKRAGGA